MIDKRLELTPKQIKLVEEFQGILDEMDKENIGFIADYDEDGYGFQGIKMYNKSIVTEIGYDDDLEYEYQDNPDAIIYSLYPEELEELPLPNYEEDQMDVDPDLYDLPDFYNDNIRHLIVLLKD